MKSINLFLLILTGVWHTACKQPTEYDASGNFEADEIIVSAQQNGLLLSLDIKEGQHLAAHQKIGQIDTETQKLQKEQTLEVLQSLNQKTVSAAPQTELIKKQLQVQQEQLEFLKKEKLRIQNLVTADAAPTKQLDDINQQIIQIIKQMEVTTQQIVSQRETSAIQNRTILSEKAPLLKSIDQIQHQIDMGTITNPISGTVLTKYASEGEIATFGRPLYKIANLDTLSLKAYITGNQLTQIKLGQTVTVRIDDQKEAYKNYSGTINWIADKSEFTPKTIQTKNERQNLVYAIKISVPNDGLLKIGMYGEVLFNLETK